MRVGLLVRTLGTNGGTERFVIGLTHWLIAHGHSVVVHAAGVEQPVPGATVRLLSVQARGRVGKLRALAEAARHIDRADQDVLLGFLRAGSPDIYRAGGGSHRAWMAKRGRGRLDLLGRYGDQIEAELDHDVLARARVVVANSEMARRDLVRFDGVDPDKLVLVRNGVDLARFQPIWQRPSSRQAPRALFLGNGWARKNLSAVLRALVMLPDFQLTVAGVERHPRHWQRLARRLGIADRVRWLGRVDRPEDLLPLADVFVLPSHYDPCANVCMEALACGVPVITTASNGAHEVLPEPWMTVPSPDDGGAFPGILAAAMARTLLDPGLGERCRAVAQTLPDDGAFQQITRLALTLHP